MSIDSRLNTIQKQIDDNADLYQVMPDFDKWSEDQLNQYIIGWYNSFVIDNRLKTLEDEDALLKKWLSRNLITQQEYDLMIDAIKEIWRQKNEHIKATGETEGIFFIDSD